MTTPKQTTLFRAGAYTHVVPRRKGLQDVFMATQYGFDFKSHYAAGVVRAPIPLLYRGEAPNGKPSWIGHAGLEPLLREQLKRMGHVVLLAGSRPTLLGEPDVAMLEGGESFLEPLVGFVGSRERGLIRFDPLELKPADLIAEIARAWPTARVLIVSHHLDVCRRLRDDLKKFPWIGRPSFHSSVRDPVRIRRVAISTYSRTFIARGAEFDLCIAIDPWEFFAGAGHWGRRAIMALGGTKLFGLAPTTVERPSYALGQIAALFGPDEVSIVGKAVEARAITVALERIDGGLRPPRDAVSFEVKRSGVWGHDVRNRRIARLVSLLAADDRKELRNKFPKVAAALGSRKVDRVIVAVEGVEQAAGLLPWMRDSRIVASPEVFIDGLADEVRAAVRRGGATKGSRSNKAIVTVEGMQYCGRFDCVVRADAGRGLPAIDPAELVQIVSEDRPMLIVDFADRHHPILRRWSKQRQAAYRKARWTIASEPMQSPLDAFLESRPRPGPA